MRILYFISFTTFGAMVGLVIGALLSNSVPDSLSEPVTYAGALVVGAVAATDQIRRFWL